MCELSLSVCAHLHYTHAIGLPIHYIIHMRSSRIYLPVLNYIHIKVHRTYVLYVYIRTGTLLYAGIEKGRIKK